MQQSFGGIWTVIKLTVLDEYLRYYTTVMKNQKFKLCYIDLFAGSGSVTIKGADNPIDGSARVALKYDFDEYIFIEQNHEYCEALRSLKADNPNKNISIYEGDGNELFNKVLCRDWYSEWFRGVIFLDPYAMDLDWETLKAIVKHPIFDIWYLFPLMALNRNLKTDGRINDANRKKIDKLLGTQDWYDALYSDELQVSMFDYVKKEKANIQMLREYIINRFKEIFPSNCVSKNALILRLPQNDAPLFLLCFAISNGNEKARVAALKGVNSQSKIHSRWTLRFE